MEIYVITAGEYSDYHVCAATTDKGKAEKLKTFFSRGWDDAQIETYQDGAFDDLTERGYTLYEVLMNETGVVQRINVNKDSTFGIGCVYDWSKDSAEFAYRVSCFAKDPNHAEKIAHDKLAQYKAEQAGL